MYYIFDTSMYEEYGITDEPTLSWRVSFQGGSLIGAKLPAPLVFQVDNTKRHPPPDFTKLVIPVMSERLVGALEGLGVDNLQTFDAVLQNPESGERWTDYRAVNIVGAVSAADMSKSRYKDIGGTGTILVEFRKLVVSEAKARGTLLFRLAESPDMILAHESIRDGILAHEPELRGLQFQEVAMS